MKKNTPLSLIQALHPIYLQNLDILEQIKPDDKSLLYFKDKDPDSDFIFKVTEQKLTSGKVIFNFVQKPSSKDILVIGANHGIVDFVVKQFENWVAIIREFDATPSIYDDPILSNYEKYYTERLNIVDEDADYAPFEPEKQFLLDNYLAKAEETIDKYKVDKSEEEIQELEELKIAASEIRKNLGKSSKQKVVQKLATFWGKTHKFRLELIKTIFVESTKEITKALITGQVSIEV